MKALICVLILLSEYVTASAQSVQAYFSDRSDTIEKVVVAELSNARSTVLVQAYRFTSNDIYDALRKLNDSDVAVAVLLDRSNVYANSKLQRMQRKKIDVYIDDSPAIAHNKIIIIDSQEVLTGSYNWTEHSKSNAENLIIIREPSVVHAYIDNWFRRQKKSKSKFRRGPAIAGAQRVKMYRR